MDGAPISLPLDALKEEIPTAHLVRITLERWGESGRWDGRGRGRWCWWL